MTTQASARRRPEAERRSKRLAGPTQAVQLVLADGSARVEPLSADIHTALFGRCLHEGRTGLVEVWAARRPRPEAALRPVTSRHDPAYFPPAGDLRALVQLARRHRKDREEAFASPLTRREPGAGKGAVESGRVVWIDVDDPGEIWRLRSFAHRPHLVVASGSGGLHAYWRLDRELEGDWLDAANRRLAAHLRADPQSCDRGRALRLPGTINQKVGAWCRVVLCDLAGPGLDPDRLLAETPPDPRPPAPPRRGPACSPPRHNAATEIPPPVYFERLAGIPVPERGGYVRCPLHEERTPSCMVWPEAERGFACFGCGVAGRIYDFASALGGGPTGRELRGEAFREARRWVNAAFGLRP